MQKKIEQLKNSIESWPASWTNLLEFFKTEFSGVTGDGNFWKALVNSTLSAKELESEEAYKAFFHKYWTHMRPEILRSNYSFITAAEYGLDVLIANQLNGLNPEQCAALLASTTANKDTALHYAVRNGELLTTTVLIEHGSNINARGFMGATPLHIAADGGFTSIVDLLLSKDANYDLKRSDGLKAIHIAAAYGYPMIVEQIVKKDRSQLNTQSGKTTTPFYEAASSNQLEVMKKLIDLGTPNVNFINPQNKTSAMHYAAHHGNFEMVLLLSTHGAKVELADQNELTPLHHAVSNTKPSSEVIAHLLENGADVNAGDPPPLYVLSSTIDEDTVTPEAQAAAKLLLQNGAQINSATYGEAFFDSYEERSANVPSGGL
ncbi:ankyrin repeat protein [Legionella massiliensis]|uniref:Ankyrin repeat protein n=1 Tax=Legionella massiliensis TaxID=1034943 RepID=A0A078L2C0_9GAMM|nr:ankyrin repeat domain-containing protein [Legionella massiliensis]CDZ78148.1 ankyrin repeat protein [Legionella massiliensis]CEE13886.1 Ankyrin repeats (3 copies) [Legionella massiliensis]